MANAGNPGSAVATRQMRQDGLAIEKIITSEDARTFIEPFLPEGMDARRVAASIILAIRKDESGKLKQCTPESLIMGAARILQWGAELGVTAYLIPFGKTATPVRDYKFLAGVSAACGYPMEAHPVREGDHFEYEYGLTPVLRHQPRARKGAPVTHAYVIIRPPRNAQPIIHVMTAEEIDTIRLQHSKQWKNGPLLGWYAAKTVCRQAVKLLPQDPRLAAFVQAVEEDATAEIIDEPSSQAGQLPEASGAEGGEQETDGDGSAGEALFGE